LKSSVAALHKNAPEARSEGSQGQVRSAAKHAAPGNQPKDEQPGTGDRHAERYFSVGPSGLAQSSSLIQGQRADALAPGYLPRRLRRMIFPGPYLLSAPPAHDLSGACLLSAPPAHDLSEAYLPRRLRRMIFPGPTFLGASGA